MEPSIDEKIFDELSEYNDSTILDQSMDTKKCFNERVNDSATVAIADMWAVWTQLGLPSRRLQARMDDVVNLLQETLNHCVKTEKDSLSNMIKYKDYRLKQIQDMLQALHLPPFEVQHELSLLHVAKMLRDKFEELKKVKDERMEQLHKLLEKRDALCHSLGQSAEEIKLETNIPAEFEIMQLQSSVSNLEVEKNKRFKKFQTVKKALISLCTTLEIEAKTDFEKKVLSEPEKEFIFSDKNIDKVISMHQTLVQKIEENKEKKGSIVERLEYLWKQLDMQDEGDRILLSYSGISDRVIEDLTNNELKRFEEMRKERMAEFIEKVKLDVSDWWEACLFDDDKINDFKQKVDEMESESEEVLNVWEEHLKSLQQFHADNKKIFDSLDQWRSCWEEFEVIENNEKDPDRYKNRRIPSTQIMKEQQKKKQLERNIAKLEDQLVSISRDLESQGKPFHVYTTLLSDYVEGKRHKHEELKENEKAKKKNSKAKQTAMEAQGLSRAQSRGGIVVPRSQPTPTKRTAGLMQQQFGYSRDNLDPSPTKSRKFNSKQTTTPLPMAPPLTRQATITKSSSSLKKPIPHVGSSSLATRGRTASQMSILSVNEEEFQAGLKAAAATPARPQLNSTYVRE